jgi:hypothetical protein
MLESTCLGSCLNRSMSDKASAPPRRASAVPTAAAAFFIGDVSVIPLLLQLLLFGATVEELSSCFSSAFCAIPESDDKLLLPLKLLIGEVPAVVGGLGLATAVATTWGLLLLVGALDRVDTAAAGGNAVLEVVVVELLQSVPGWVTGLEVVAVVGIACEMLLLLVDMPGVLEATV